MSKKIVAYMLTWVSLLANAKPWISWSPELKLLQLGWISLALHQRVMAWSLMRKAWMNMTSRVYEWDLFVVLAC